MEKLLQGFQGRGDFCGRPRRLTAKLPSAEQYGTGVLNDAPDYGLMQVDELLECWLAPADTR